MDRKQASTGEPTPEQEALEPVIPKPNDEDGFQPAVSWLLGSQLLGALKPILLHLIYSKRLDHRDWMRGEILHGQERFLTEDREQV